MSRWQSRAACRGKPVEWWFVPPSLNGVPTREHEQALRLCARCPVSKQCAKAGKGEIGTWAGRYRTYKSRDRDELVGWVEAFERSIDQSVREFEEVNG